MKLEKNTDVKKYRDIAGITQKQLSAMTHIDETNISKLENDKIELFDGWKKRLEMAFNKFEGIDLDTGEEIIRNEG